MSKLYMQDTCSVVALFKFFLKVTNTLREVEVAPYPVFALRLSIGTLQKPDRIHSQGKLWLDLGRIGKDLFAVSRLKKPRYNIKA